MNFMSNENVILLISVKLSEMNRDVDLKGYLVRKRIFFLLFNLLYWFPPNIHCSPNKLDPRLKKCKRSKKGGL